MGYPAFERILYELLCESEQEARFNENRALTHLKTMFKAELPPYYQDSLKYFVSLAREMLQEARLLDADRRSGVSIPFTISKQGQQFLKQKAEIKCITLVDLMAYASFVDFINYQVTIRINQRYEQKYDDSETLAVLNEESKRHRILHQADNFLSQYDSEINKRFKYFCIYDMRKEDISTNSRNKLAVVMAINHCRNLLTDNNTPKPKNQEKQLSNSDIPSMIAEQNNKLREDLLAKIKVITPKQFEELSVLILGHLLYEGQPLNEFKKHLKQQGQSGDGGIDGIVTKYDRIRGNVIHYVQSKRYTTNSVQRPEVQRFVGALDPHRAKIGVFMTTSKFTEGAEEYVKSLNMYDVRLIDGFELVEMMIEHKIGVKKIADLSLVELDSAFFDTKESLLV